MAIRTNENAGKTIFTIASLDSDWNYSTDFPNYPNGIRVLSVQYVPTGPADVFYLKDGSATGPTICYCSSLNNFIPKYFFDRRIKPFYDVSDGNICTASIDAEFILIMDE